MLNVVFAVTCESCQVFPVKNALRPASLAEVVSLGSLSPSHLAQTVPVALRNRMRHPERGSVSRQPV